MASQPIIATSTSSFTAVKTSNLKFRKNLVLPRTKPLTVKDNYDENYKNMMMIMIITEDEEIKKEHKEQEGRGEVDKMGR
jgi:hypothetical protein